MQSYRESNFFQKMAFNRIVYGFLLITLQLVLAAIRLPHPSTNFFVTNFAASSIFRARAVFLGEQ